MISQCLYQNKVIGDYIGAKLPEVWLLTGVITFSDNGEPPLLSRGECEKWPVSSCAVYLKLNPVGK